MKRRLQDIDISDYYFIEAAVLDRMAHVKTKQLNRDDIRTYFAKHFADPYYIHELGLNFVRAEERDYKMRKKMRTHFAKDLLHSIYDEGLDSIVTELQNEILNCNLILEPVTYETRVDKSNGKLRKLTIEHIKQQFYDYIAARALEPLMNSVVGHYQIACKKGYGPTRAAKIVQKWMNQKDTTVMVHMDVHQCYHSIRHRNMMNWLCRHVKNTLLIILIGLLLATVAEGLPIGSYLSIKLSALYLSDLFHRLENSYYQFRRCKKLNVVRHLLFYLDDIFIFGSNTKSLMYVASDIRQKAADLGLEIKKDWQLFHLHKLDKKERKNKKKDKVCLDILGYKVYATHVTMRHRDYTKLKKALRRFSLHRTLFYARSLCARFGLFALQTNSNRFCRKYNAYNLYHAARKVISNHDKKVQLRLEAA